MSPLSLPPHCLEIRRVYTLDGPNVWCRSPALEALVDLGPLEDAPSNTIPGFNQRVMSWLPSMIEHQCSIGERGGWFERLRQGTYMGHILEHVALELQSLAGTPIGFGRTRETKERGVYKVVIKFVESALAVECLKTARDLLLAAVQDLPFDVPGAIRKLRDLADDVCLGPSTAAIAKAAKARGIPVRRLPSGSLLQLGFGAKQRRIRAAETDNTSAIAEDIARDKELTKCLLGAVGVSVPQGRIVASPEDAWHAAQEIGVPVVVKPTNANHGRGVTLNLMTREEVFKAYDFAEPEGDHVMVEQYAEGTEYRLLVVAGKMAAASRGEPDEVTGDGTRTIRELVAEVNSDPRRGEDWQSPLCKVFLNADAVLTLKKQGYTFDSVPPAGQKVLVHFNGELLTDVTDEVHPDCAAQAELAARVVGLDVAGVDLVVGDISRPWHEQKGMILEVNAGPGLQMHLEPQHGTPRPVAEAILNTMFAPGQNGRIPLVAITGTRGKTAVAQLVAHGLQAVYSHVGLASSRGIFVGDTLIEPGECTGPSHARALLAHPDVDVAVVETSAAGILRGGVAFDTCDVGVVTNIGHCDFTGMDDIDSPERMVWVKRSVVDVVAPQTGTAVVNAQDPLAAAMGQYSRGKVLYFADAAEDPVTSLHRQAGGRCVLVHDEHVLLAEGDREESLLPLSAIPVTLAGQDRDQVQNVLAAVAALWSLNVPPRTIRDRLASFQSVGKTGQV